MSNIIEFGNKELLYKYLKETKGVNFNKCVGFGSEGSCYLSKKDNDVYKVFEMCFGHIDPKEIITTKDIDLESFAFPKKLFSVDNNLEAYTSKLVKKDYLKIIDEDDIYILNFDALIKAYYKMVKDVEKLTKEQVNIYDLSYNLLFDGKNLVGIDTCHYERREGDLLEHNLDCLDSAVKDPFTFFLKNNDYEIDKDLEVEEYCKVLQKDLKNNKIITY